MRCTLLQSSLCQNVSHPRQCKGEACLVSSFHCTLMRQPRLVQLCLLKILLDCYSPISNFTYTLIFQFLFPQANLMSKQNLLIIYLIYFVGFSVEVFYFIILCLSHHSELVIKNINKTWWFCGKEKLQRKWINKSCLTYMKHLGIVSTYLSSHTLSHLNMHILNKRKC